MRKTPVLHPFLFALYFIIFIWAYNASEISFSEIVLPIFVSLFFTTASFMFFRLWLDNVKAAVMTSSLLILFFSYGHVYNLTQGIRMFSFEIVRHRSLSLLYICILTSIFIILKKRKSNFLKITRYLNYVAIILIAIALINLAGYTIKNTTWNISNDAGLLSPQALSEKSKFPDVYYIILDGYPRADVLAEAYSYDNSSFISMLKSKGFYVASNSRSNYPMTFLSLASSLNMQYLDKLVEKVGPGAKGKRIPNEAYQNSLLQRFFKRLGYKTIYFASGWGPTNRNKYADIEFKKFCLLSSEVISNLVGSTWLQPFSLRFIEMDARKRILDAFAELKNIPDIDGQKFTFVHFLIPHTPLFKKNGEPLSLSSFSLKAKVSKDDYINQIIFLNKKVEELLDSILSKSKVDPIIILQADHGSASDGWQVITKELVQERTAILNAYHLPDNGSRYLYKSITPVNSFRLIFNSYFGTNYKLLPDRVYFSTYDYPYKFTEEFDNN